MVVQGNETIEAETYARIEKYFVAALELEKQERLIWLNDVLSDDLEILQEVKLLLSAHQDADTFLAEPAPVKETIDAMTSRCPDLTGRRLGVYEVIRKIARGGMGRIYAAKRVDGEYEQNVAIKVVEFANLETGLFQQERQLLADFQHPNIVTLLDGGTLPEGFPYLVMECVEGIAIDCYVNEAKLTIQQKVKLCSELCAVVEDAHQQGIVHCDLKPDNILVINKGTRKGTLKLLDFGIAQSLSLSNKTKDSSKQHGLTPEYSSRQRHQNRLPHKSDDVFSLGVILGELLSGQTPTLAQKTSLSQRKYKTPNINALAEPIKDKELVQILHQATADRRKGRYQSAQALQYDLQNWLDEKPIDAAQGGWVYFYSKYVFRYRQLLFGLISLALFALLVGQITGQHLEYQESSDLRRNDAKEAINDLNHLLLTIPHTPVIEKEVTVIILSRLQDWHKATPDSAILKKLYANILARLGNVNGHPYYLNLGKLPEARDHYQRALMLYQQIEDLEDSRFDEVTQQSAVIHQHFIKHRLVELDIYQKGGGNADVVIEACTKMKQIRDQLTQRQFVNLSTEEHILWINMLLSGAYESLRIKSFIETRSLLFKAKKMLANLSLNNGSNEQDYLQAFYYEITGHMHYLQGNVNDALASYSKIKRSYTNDEKNTGRYRYLLTRVDSAFACLGYLQQTTTLRQQHFKYFEYARISLETLAREYQDVPFLQYQSDNMSHRLDISTSTGKQTFCAKPVRFLLPPA
jgi:serine/threonine protein kinase